MNHFLQLGKLLLIVGIGITAAGVLFILLGKLKWFGHLPGDIYIQKKNFSFYFPLGSSILISIILTLFFWLFSRR